MKLNDALVHALISLDVRYIFGVSGTNIEHFHDAIHRLGGTRLRSVMTKGEAGAAFMADCRGRVHRTLGVCCSTSGGGMMNLLTGIAESYAESVPVLALVGQSPAALDGMGAFQESSGIGRTTDALQLWNTVTKYTAKISRPDDFWPCLKKAVISSLSGRPGPSALLLPRNAYYMEVDPCLDNWGEEIKGLVQTGELPADEISRLFDAMASARHPVFILGQGVRRSSDPQAVVEFARKSGIPVVTTMSAKGEFPNEDPLYLGVVGVAGHPSVHAFLKERADLFIVVGTGLNFMTRHPLGCVPSDRKFAVVNIDPDGISRVVPAFSLVNADAGKVFRMMLELFKADPFAVQLLSDYVHHIYEPCLFPSVLHEKRAKESGRGCLLQSQAISLLQEILPEGGHILYDAGNCATASLHMTKVPRGSSSTIALGMGGMGYSIGGSIGAQLGSPAGTRTVVFAGDGAFLIAGCEIHTAVDLGLPILYVIFNNNMHGMCAMRQQLYFDSRLECVSYAPIDVAGVARGFGDSRSLWVGSAATEDELRRQLAEYMKNSNLPGVLELRLAREELPPFTPFLPESAVTIPICK
jgi:acetolactate synthase-1/2/3 large subunit